jgi:hypothetical protein
VRLAARPEPEALEAKKKKLSGQLAEEDESEEELERAKESISRIRKGGHQVKFLGFVFYSHVEFFIHILNQIS